MLSSFCSTRGSCSVLIGKDGECGVAVQTDSLELAAFVCRATPRIRAALRKRGPRGSALEDCIQDVLIDVVERWPKLKSYPPAARDSYVRAICRGTAVGWRRRARNDGDRFTDIDREGERESGQPISPERQ